jgi:putative transposase
MTARLVQRAYKFALAPSTSAEGEFTSHAGGARFAFNWGVDQVAQALDAYGAEKAAGVARPLTKIPGHFELCRLWTEYKNRYENEPDPRIGRDLAWVGNNSVGTYQAALRDAAAAWHNFNGSRTGARAGRRMGRPRFKSRHRSPAAFQVHGQSLYLKDKSHINLPRIGEVKIPGKIRIGVGRPAQTHRRQGATGQQSAPVWEDRNARIARSLARALRKGDVECPTCAATPGLGSVLRRDPNDKTKLITTQVVCEDCKVRVTAADGTKSWVATLRVPVCRIVRASITRGASGTWWCSVTAQVVMDVAGERCAACAGSGQVVAAGPRGDVIDKCKPCAGDGMTRTPTRRQRRNGAVGLDLGTRYVAVDSDGSVYPNPRHLEAAMGELVAAQKALSRTQPDSNRRAKARRRLGTIHERVALMRKDSSDRFTTALARTFASVAVEGWDAQQVAERGDKTVPKKVRRRRNRELADAAPGMVRWQLKYKTSWGGALFYQAAKHQETGRTCSVCGVVRAKPVPLNQELFVCDACGVQLDRRVNAARVVRRLASGQGGPGGAPAPPPQPRGGDVRPETPRRGRHSPTKRAARSRSPDPPAGTPEL